MKETKNVKYLVRILNTDLDGNKQIVRALCRIKGISFMFANALCTTAGVNKTEKAGTLNDEQIKKLDQIAKHPEEYGIPIWMFNRRTDPETGEDKHLITADLDFTTSNDIKMMKKVKSYRGVRHGLGLPVRGQRTKSNFRRSKSRGKGGSLGVVRKKGKGGRV